MNKLLRSKKRGSAIPLVVVVVVIMLAMGTGLLSMGLNSRVFSTRTTSDITARCAADTGLTMALYEMNQKLVVKPWSSSSLPSAKETNLLYSDATYTYNVTGDLNKGFIMAAVGKSDNAVRAVYATIGLKGLFEHAILTKGSLILKSNTVIDGYNSADPFDTDFNVDIGTQSTADSMVVLNSGVNVKGDVLVGLGGNPDTVIKDLGAKTGDKLGGTENDPLPTIKPPATLLDKATDIAAKSATITLTPADSGQYSSIILAASKQAGILEIDGGDVVLYITGDIDLGNACEIIIRDKSSLTIYIDGDIVSGNGASIGTENPSKDAKTLQLYGTGGIGQNLDIKAKNEWTGVIYAPNAHVDLYANGDAYGAIVADSFEFKNGGNYYYDEALREVSMEDDGVSFVIERWYEGRPTFSPKEIITTPIKIK
jgi:choice-of-anchor A domain-containing protein